MITGLGLPKETPVLDSLARIRIPVPAKEGLETPSLTLISGIVITHFRQVLNIIHIYKYTYIYIYIYSYNISRKCFFLY